jgi:glutathione S-transferase
MRHVNGTTAGYWAIRGLAAPVRLLLAFTKTEYKEDLYHYRDDAATMREEWQSVKRTMPLDFSNLPYYIDGDVKITQSNAILRHIGRKAGLTGATAADAAVVDMLVDELVDARGDMSRSNYTGVPTAADVFANSLPPRFAAFEKFIAKAGGPFLLGAHVTIADFLLYELCDKARVCAKETVGIADVLAEYPRLSAFVAAFEALPGVAEYIKSAAYIARPFNGKTALWT